MKALLRELKTALTLTVVLVVLLGGAYPFVVWAGAQLFFRDQANGSLIVDTDGTVRGSALLGQNFSGERYFHPRPSAAGAGYDAAGSCGSNLGPTSAMLDALIVERAAAYRTVNRLPANATVPADAVTSSASGLDPHISPANAALQARRVAASRGLPLDVVAALVAAHTTGRDLGVFGEPGVNVVFLNRALDAQSGTRVSAR